MKAVGVCSSALLVLVVVTVSEAIECVDPRPLVDGWVTSMDGTDSAALVREKCTRMRDHSVLSWKPGKHVRTNCASIPRWTAIASFVDGEYRGRAAIFESCDFLGIWAYYQTSDNPVDLRLIRHRRCTPQNNAENFYVVELWPSS